MKLLVVNYHYFRENAYSSGIYPTNERQLLRQIEKIAETYHFISLQHLALCLKKRIFPPGQYCLLTFDDGLKEQMDVFCLLSKMGIPSAYFVPTKPIANCTVLGVHKLHHIRTQLTDEQLFELLDDSYGIGKAKFDSEALAVQYRYDNELARKLKYYLNFELNDIEREVFLDKSFLELVGDESAFARNLYMNIEDLRALARVGCLGSHGYSHQPLAKLPVEQAMKDIVRSLQFLNSVAGETVSAFSYPYGGSTAVSYGIAEILREEGVVFAFTMQRGVNSESDFDNPYFLKRVDTNDAPGSETFEKAF